jgi:WD40 repeat protein
MSIQVVCACGKQYWVEDTCGGRHARCSACGRALDVPDPGEAEEVALEDDELPAPAALDLDHLHLKDEPPPGDGTDLWEGHDRHDRHHAGPAPVAEVDDDPAADYHMTAESELLPDRLPGEAEGEVRVVGELERFHLVDEDAVVTCVAGAADNEHVLAGLAEEVYVLNLKTGKTAYTFEKHEEPVTCVAFAPDGRLALSGDEDGGLAVWEVAGGRHAHWLEGHEGAVLSVAVAADGQHAVSGGQDASLRMWELATGRQLARFGDRAPVTRAVFSPDGALILSGNERGEVCLWDVSRGGLLRELTGPVLGRITSVGFTAGGVTALAAGSRLARPGPPLVGQWDATYGKRLACFDAPTRNRTTIRCTAFSPDGQYLLAGGGYTSEGEDGGGLRVLYTPVRLWSVERGTALRTFQGHMRTTARWTPGMPLATVHCVAICPDGRRGLSGGDDGRVEVWGLI